MIKIILTTIYMFMSHDGVVSVYVKKTEEPSLRECLLRKRQLEYHPPIGDAFATFYFCSKEQEI